jgi:hypothetical protein
MSTVGDPPASGQIAASRAARESLSRFIEAAMALDAAWHPAFDRKASPAYLPSFDSFMRDLIVWRDDVDERGAVAESDIPPPAFTDPEAVRAWLEQLSAQVDCAVSAGEDATRPTGQRSLGRAMARSTLLEARRALEQLLEAATRGVWGLTAG